jgi:hypothetical protein
MSDLRKIALSSAVFSGLIEQDVRLSAAETGTSLVRDPNKTVQRRAAIFL